MTDKTNVIKKELSISDFYTVPAAEKGRRVPLALPDGTPTAFYLTVVGGDAPAAHEALMAAIRAIRDIPENLSDAEKKEARDEIVLAQRCALVIGGNLPGGFSAEAVRGLLRNNPSLADSLERISSTPSLFFASAPSK